MPGPDGRGGHYLTFADRQLIADARAAFRDGDFVVCQCLDDDGLMTCGSLPTWRVTVRADDEPNPPTWTVCQGHLGDAILIARSNYGAPIVITDA